MLRLRRVGRGDRGASAVEFALVVPWLLLILLGILESAFYMRDYLSVASAVRVGARTASSGADAGVAACPPGSALWCRQGDIPKFADAAVSAILTSGSSMPDDAIDEIWVYKANAAGFPGQALTQDAMLQENCIPNASTDLRCVKYNRVAGVWQPVSPSAWDWTSVNACIDNPDSVGVYIRATHDFFTGWIASVFGNNSIRDRAVLSFEPLSPETCEPGARS
jgi:hypothetical protein